MRIPDRGPLIDPTTAYDGVAMAMSTQAAKGDDDNIFNEMSRSTKVPMFPGPPRPQNTPAPEEGIIDELSRSTKVPMFPGPPRPQNTPAPEEGIIDELSRSTKVPMFPGPPRPQNTLAEKDHPFEQFARRTAPVARSSGAGSGGGSKPPPYPPNRQLQLAHNAALAFFLAAIGFFFLSLIWNLYLQVGLAREHAKKTDANAVEAMRLDSAAPFGFRIGKRVDNDSDADGAVKRGEGGWLRGANANANANAADGEVRA
jgi:hypothetical protein